MYFCLPAAYLETSQTRIGQMVVQQHHWPNALLSDYDVSWNDRTMNFAFTPRSALLFNFICWMCLDQGIPLSDAVMNTPLILLSFRLSVTRVLQGLQSETMSFLEQTVL